MVHKQGIYLHERSRGKRQGSVESLEYWKNLGEDKERKKSGHTDRSEHDDCRIDKCRGYLLPKDPSFVEYVRKTFKRLWQRTAGLASFDEACHERIKLPRKL